MAEGGLAGAPLFTMLRYDLDFDAMASEGTITRHEAQRFQGFDAPEDMPRLHDLATAAARGVVVAEHLRFAAAGEAAGAYPASSALTWNSCAHPSMSSSIDVATPISALASAFGRERPVQGKGAKVGDRVAHHPLHAFGLPRDELEFRVGADAEQGRRHGRGRRAGDADRVTASAGACSIRARCARRRRPARTGRRPRPTAPGDGWPPRSAAAPALVVGQLVPEHRAGLGMGRREASPPSSPAGSGAARRSAAKYQPTQASRGTGGNGMRRIGPCPSPRAVTMRATSPTGSAQPSGASTRCLRQSSASRRDVIQRSCHRPRWFMLTIIGDRSQHGEFHDRHRDMQRGGDDEGQDRGDERDARHQEHDHVGRPVAIAAGSWTRPRPRRGGVPTTARPPPAARAPAPPPRRARPRRGP